MRRGLRRSYVRRVVVMQFRRGIALLLVAGFVACTDDGDARPTAADNTTVAAAPAVAATENTDLEAAFEFAECMRDNGIEDFLDPQIRADGDYFLEPPAGVGEEELKTGESACGHILGPPSTGAAVDTDDAAAGWERIVPGGDCQCADGSEFSFWVREANPDRVVFYLQDGGACFSAGTCAPDSDLYETMVSEGPSGEGGIFDLADVRNPFADYSVVYVPYCTGDVHLGNTTVDYAPGLTVHHKGYVNGAAALDHLAATFPGATEVVVVGESAGSIASPLYGGLVSDRLPDARITVVADGSGSYPDVPRANEILAAWGTGDAVSNWPDLTVEHWSFPGLFIQSGRHQPDIVFARHDYAYDENQQAWYPLAGIPARDLLSLIDANETKIEGAGVNLHSYIASGDAHSVLSDGTFYSETINGVKLVDWVTTLIESGRVDDVHCTDCRTD